MLPIIRDKDNLKTLLCNYNIIFNYSSAFWLLEFSTWCGQTLITAPKKLIKVTAVMVVMEAIILTGVLGKKLSGIYSKNLIVKLSENHTALKLSQRFQRNLTNRLASTDPQVHSLITDTLLDMIMILKATLSYTQIVTKVAEAYLQECYFLF